MWPWGHLGIAYLAFVLYDRLDARRQQSTATLAALAVGSQFPDLVDKPLAWTVAVLPSGRSLGHSLLTLAVVGYLCFRVAAWYHRTDVAEAFVFGWLIHLLTDPDPAKVAALLAGDMSQLQWFYYFVWPLYGVPEPDSQTSIIAYILTVSPDPYIQFQFALFAAAIVVWIREGTPGLEPVRRLLSSQRSDP